MVEAPPGTVGERVVPAPVPIPVPFLLALFPLPSAPPQITRRIGKSFAQLLTSRAVLMAVGLAAVGGGRGWMF